MAEYSLTSLFILPTSNTLPTTGTDADLVANQFGIFKPDFTPATAGNVASQKYIYLAQGRPSKVPGVGTKNSDKIYLANVIEWYKVTAHSTASVQITDITDFSAVCGEDVTISMRLFSFYNRTRSFNGFTRSFTITTPCCDCGDNPCDTVDAEALIDQFVEKINNDPIISAHNIQGHAYIIAEKLQDDDDNFFLRLNGVALDAENRPCDPSAYPYIYDFLKFYAWAYKGPETTQDYNVWDSCDPFATVTTVQNPSFLTGSSDQVAQVEKNFNSMNTAPIAKALFKYDIFNSGFTSQVVDGTYYDFYYLKFKQPQGTAWTSAFPQDEAVMIYNPTGQNSGTITVLTTFLGTPTNDSPVLFTTTTTTSTTTTTL